jgi:hypothetical protein
MNQKRLILEDLVIIDANSSTKEALPADQYYIGMSKDGLGDRYLAETICPSAIEDDPVLLKNRHLCVSDWR